MSVGGVRRLPGLPSTPPPAAWRGEETQQPLSQLSGLQVRERRTGPGLHLHCLLAFGLSLIFKSEFKSLCSLTRSTGWSSLEEEPCPGPGMSSVVGWLKYHRLHKYSSVLMVLSYQQLLDLTQDKLLAMGATMGAARKIYKCVQNLHKRPETLRGICENLEAGKGEMRQHIAELEDVIRSPVLVEEDGGGAAGAGGAGGGGVGGGAGGGGAALVEQMVLSLTRLTSRLLLCPRTDHKTAGQFVGLLDCCLSSPHFSAHHRQLFQSWKQKVKIIWTSQPLSGFLGN